MIEVKTEAAMDNTLDTKDWEKTNMQVFWGEIAPCDHVVQIYENDEVFFAHTQKVASRRTRMHP